MNTKFCSPKCFNDKELENHIIPELSEGRGDCFYSNTKNQIILEPSKLSEHFEPLLDIYLPNPDGKFLFEWLNKDWLLFDQSKITDEKSQLLLSDIFDNPEIIHQKFAPRVDSQSQLMISWSTLTEELMYTNRFFPETFFDFTRLEKPFANLMFYHSADSVEWFRARINENDQCYECDEMGAPPPRRASHGRANPSGIPYLYLGSNIKTAVAEVRPHPGQNVCVGQFKIVPNLQLVDLCNPRSLISPFTFILADDVPILNNLRSGDIEFLEKLGQDLSQPINPNSSAVEYTKSQYICEYIKKSNHQGVIYNSSVRSDGINLALFDPTTATCGEVTEYRITGVSVEMEKI